MCLKCVAITLKEDSYGQGNLSRKTITTEKICIFVFDLASKINTLTKIFCNVVLQSFTFQRIYCYFFSMLFANFKHISSCNEHLISVQECKESNEAFEKNSVKVFNCFLSSCCFSPLK